MFILITYGNLMTLFFCYIPDVVNTALTELLPSLSTTILSSCTRKLLLFLKSMVKSLLFIRTIRPATRNDKIWSNLSCTHYQIGTKNKEKKKNILSHSTQTPEFAVQKVICYLVVHLLCLKDKKNDTPSKS